MPITGAVKLLYLFTLLVPMASICLPTTASELTNGRLPELTDQRLAQEFGIIRSSINNSDGSTTVLYTDTESESYMKKIYFGPRHFREIFFAANEEVDVIEVNGDSMLHTYIEGKEQIGEKLTYLGPKSYRFQRYVKIEKDKWKEIENYVDDGRMLQCLPPLDASISEVDIFIRRNLNIASNITRSGDFYSVGMNLKIHSTCRSYPGITAREGDAGIKQMAKEFEVSIRSMAICLQREARIATRRGRRAGSQRISAALMRLLGKFDSEAGERHNTQFKLMCIGSGSTREMYGQAYLCESESNEYTPGAAINVGTLQNDTESLSSDEAAFQRFATHAHEVFHHTGHLHQRYTNSEGKRDIMSECKVTSPFVYDMTYCMELCCMPSGRPQGHVDHACNSLSLFRNGQALPVQAPVLPDD